MVKQQPDELSKYCDVANEAATLGSMIVDDSCIPDVMLVVSKEAFVRVEHQDIFEALRRLWFEQSEKFTATGKRAKIDAVLLRSKLMEMGKLNNNAPLDNAGGVDYLRKVMESVPSAATAVYYAEQVRKKQIDREVMATADEIHEIGHAPGDPYEKREQLQAKALELEDYDHRQKFVKFTDILSDAVIRIEQRRANVIETRFANIDKIIGGFCPGELNILAARPSMGKTSLALNLAQKFAEQGKPVLFFTLETGIEQVADRLLCSISQVNLAKAKRGEKLSEEEHESLHEHTAEIIQDEWPLVFSDADTPAKQLAIIRHRQHIQPLKLVIIDYIQLMNTNSREKDLRHRMTELSLQLRNIARQEKVIMLVLSQLNRSPTDRTDHRPRMSDLRESGTLEQDSDIVLLLHREEYYHKADQDWLEKNEETKGLCEVIIDKNRNGPTGVAKLLFSPTRTRFMDLCEDDIPI